MRYRENEMYGQIIQLIENAVYAETIPADAKHRRGTNRNSALPVPGAGRKPVRNPAE
jgi:hypothetical protein